MKIITFIFMIMFGLSTMAYSHSGGTNKYGCHNNHKTGGYHCH
ncbi:YHYH domain-containing protein [Candidatus Pelagibacter sp.]|jgi:hypothetical protein|nr:YHYH domain-containing protein [Candidatus Pelagibacter sp.]MDC6475909.1 YHYH domain-containing protein [Candidatus Pelagibacter sp.]